MVMGVSFCSSSSSVMGVSLFDARPLLDWSEALFDVTSVDAIATLLVSLEGRTAAVDDVFVLTEAREKVSVLFLLICMRHMSSTQECDGVHSDRERERTCDHIS